MIAFQSTLPAWGETRSRLLSAFPAAISIHSPRMGRDRTLPAARTGRTDFNPLSPHGERLPRAENPSPSPQFQSTLPAWGETRPPAATGRFGLISIHSPRMGRDRPCPAVRPRHGYFNPLSPHGERRVSELVHKEADYISIHSPRMGRDSRPRSRSWKRS